MRTGDRSVVDRATWEAVVGRCMYHLLRGRCTLSTSHTEDRCGNRGERVTTDLQTRATTAVQKRAVETIDLPDWGVRLSAKTETPLACPADAVAVDERLRRVKQRLSFRFHGQATRLDATIVNDATFEIESELVVKPSDAADVAADRWQRLTLQLFGKAL